MTSPAAQALSMFQSILLSLGQSIINHDNALYISNYYTSSPSLIESFPLQLKCNAIMMLCINTFHNKFGTRI